MMATGPTVFAMLRPRGMGRIRKAPGGTPAPVSESRRWTLACGPGRGPAETMEALNERRPKLLELYYREITSRGEVHGALADPIHTSQREFSCSPARRHCHRRRERPATMI